MGEERHIRLGNEMIFTKVMGTGEPLVFLHGGPGGEHRFFLPHLQDLSQHFTLIFYDQRGCGQSEKATNEDYTMDGEVETLEALRQFYKIEKLNLVGESWGSMLALLYAAKYPNHVNKIFMTAAVGATMDGFFRFEKELLNRLSIEERKWLEEVSPKVDAGEVDVAEIFKMIDPYYVYSPESLTKKTKTQSNARVNELIGKDIAENYDVSKDANKLGQIPMLVAQGDHDILSPEVLEQVLLSYIPHIEIRGIQNCGHWSVVEKPEQVQAMIKQFFQKE
ncbi:proline iminopeptidase [Bacillus sp. SORGH_AS 510]|uniref:alpha/beta fold hydrolase n=1 Tax=Bacillus sp. SORGH_AS_0510 TaxID=3041771 RepID=UPI0027849E36|nr:alpha/beta fold hydrolase [Bacillus sp. SORGH_AS_0510]MDQ1143910.1 proline iminopeptidase [Bacillus sp. SORGH_AS_0510]